MNHRVIVTQRGGPEVLKVIEEDIPEPQAGEVRLKVRAAGVSAYDLMMRRSASFPGFPKPPFTPGVDVVGLADVAGDGTQAIQPGEMIAASLPGGGYSDYICVPAGELVSVPPGVDPAEAVCVIANYLTAHLMLHEVAAVQGGERILVQGAAGGVGTALIELGKLSDLEMYGTASAYNHELVSALGATPIDYRNEDFVERVWELTGDGVDAVFDPIGGARQLWRSYRSLRKGGRLVWFGVAATSRHGLRVIPLSLLTRFLLSLLPDGKHAPLPPNVGHFAASHHEWYHQTLANLLESVASGRLEPVVAERIPLIEAVRAHELLERGGYAGKVVLVPSG